MGVRIFVDADACPVKAEAVRVATRYSLPILFVSHQGMGPVAGPTVEQVVVRAGFDAADDWIVAAAAAGDIVVTADILLAARCLEKGCRVLNPNGQPMTSDTIGPALAMRELNAYLRESGDIAGHNPKFTPRDRSTFLQALDLAVTRAMRG